MVESAYLDVAFAPNTARAHPFCEVLTYAFRTLSVRQQQAYTSSSLLVGARIFSLCDGVVVRPSVRLSPFAS